MKKVLSVVLIGVMFLLCLSGCNNEDEKAQSLYKQFLAGEVTAVDKEGSEKRIDEYLSGGKLGDNYTYAFIDMNGDESPEICIKKDYSMYFFTTKDGTVSHWYTAETNSYTKLLNNGAFLYEKHGAAPEHKDYRYYELNENASVKFEISFSRYDSTTLEGKTYPESYFVDEKSVSKDIYEQKTKQYLNIGDDELIWHDSNGQQI